MNRMQILAALALEESILTQAAAERPPKPPPTRGPILGCGAVALAGWCASSSQERKFTRVAEAP